MKEIVVVLGPPGMEREAIIKSVGMTGEFHGVGVATMRELCSRHAGRPEEITCLLQMFGADLAAVKSKQAGADPAWSRPRLLVETAEVPDAWLIDGLRNGAVAVIAWPCLGTELRAALEAARQGATSLTPRVGGLLAVEIRNGRPRHLGELKLSGRERQVTRMLRTGATNKEIGRKLGIAESTVERHLTSIYRKLAVQSRTEAVLCLRQFLQVKLPPGRLNTLEERIVAGILRGLGNDALADQLQVSRHTIEAHLTRAYQELGVRNRLELIAKTTKVA